MSQSLRRRCPLTVQFNVFEPGSAYNTLEDKWIRELSSTAEGEVPRFPKPTNYQVETTTLDQLIAQFGLPHFVKIDVEGHEVSVLGGLSRVVQIISFEANLPEFREESIRCVEHLEQLSSAYRFSWTPLLNFDTLEWVDAAACIHWLSRTEIRYCEIFVRQKQ
jgi:hypothetical protein